MLKNMFFLSLFCLVTVLYGADPGQKKSVRRNSLVVASKSFTSIVPSAKGSGAVNPPKTTYFSNQRSVMRYAAEREKQDLIKHLNSALRDIPDLSSRVGVSRFARNGVFFQDCDSIDDMKRARQELRSLAGLGYFSQRIRSIVYGSSNARRERSVGGPRPVDPETENQDF